jgi:hypothetical protein
VIRTFRSCVGAAVSTVPVIAGKGTHWASSQVTMSDCPILYNRVKKASNVKMIGASILSTSIPLFYKRQCSAVIFYHVAGLHWDYPLVSRPSSYRPPPSAAECMSELLLLVFSDRQRPCPRRFRTPRRWQPSLTAVKKVNNSRTPLDRGYRSR